MENSIFNVGADGHNAYLVKEGVLIDGVPSDFADEFVKNIEKHISVSEIEYIVFTHATPDRAGTLEKLLKINPDITVVGTIAAIKNIKEFVFADFKEMIAKDGATLGETIEFHITPNVPWPDTMLVYDKDCSALFSGEMFSSYNSLGDYYDDNLRQFGGFAEKCLEKIKALDVKTIYPLCGGKISDTGKAVSVYEEKINENRRRDYAALCYMSKYGSTYEMARIIADTLEDKGLKVKLFDAEKRDGKMYREINLARAVIFGAPTVNRNAPPQIWEAVCGLDAVSQRGIPCMTFGSSGWSGDAPVLIHTHLRAMNFRMFDKPFLCTFRPNADDKEKLKKHTEKFFDFIKKTGE